MKPLPPKVRVKNGAYHYDLGRDAEGRRRWRKLCRIDDGEHELYRALAAVTTPRAETMNELFDSYLGSKLFAKLAPRTQKDYLGYINGNLRLVFGETPPDAVTSGHCSQYLQRRLDADAGVVGNREIACLSTVYNYGMRIGRCQTNPCKGVRRNPQTPRTRYIRNDEFLVPFEAAPEPFQDFMAGLYLTGLRQQDLRLLRKNQITPEGIRLEETKRGKLIVIEISESLRFFLLRACSRTPNSPFVFTNTDGEPWTYWAIQSQSRRLKEKTGHDWTLHDVRAKAESDSKEGLGLLPLYRRARRIKSVR